MEGPVLRPRPWSALHGCNFGKGPRAGHRETAEGTALCTSLSLLQHPGQPQALTTMEYKCRGPEDQLWGTDTLQLCGSCPQHWPGARPHRVTPSAHHQAPSPPLFVVLFLKHQRTPTSVCWKCGVSPAAKSPAHFQTCRS